MKYTRYDLKRKNNDGVMFAAVFIGILVLAFIIGSIVSQLVYKNKGNTSAALNKTVNNAGTPQTGDVTKYIAIQGGLFNVQKYADETKNILSAYGNPFVITEENKSMRVFLGIFSEGDAAKDIKTLTDKKVDNSKMTFEVNKSDLCDAEIIGIIDGNLSILSALMPSDVNSYPSKDIKAYAAGFKDVDKSSPHYAELTELKTYVKNMPAQITKDKAAENYTEIYNILKKIKSN